MKTHPEAVLTGAHYLDGDFAAGEGAIAAGCRFVAGYPCRVHRSWMSPGCHCRATYRFLAIVFPCLPAALGRKARTSYLNFTMK